MGIANSHSILVHDLCGVDEYIVFLAIVILISIASKLWTRMEYGILVAKHTPYQHFPNFWVLNDE